MKKIICCILAFLLLMGCNDLPKSREERTTEAPEEFLRGVWLSYNEINSLIFGEKGFKAEFVACLSNMKSLKITDLYFHTVANCDSVVKSEIYPQTAETKALDFDILNYVIDNCHRENIRVHAWINPYRVTATSTVASLLPKSSPAKRLGKADVIIYNGIYLNPASENVRKTVLEGIAEIVNNYKIDGIHFDDYFYPTTDAEFDKETYESYKKATKNPLSLEEFRRTNVDMLIADCKTYFNSLDEKPIFSISPTASVDKNYNTLFADVVGWVENEYVDLIIPQLYFGFEHKQNEYRFESLLADWKELCKASKVKLVIGLAPYKIGKSNFSDGDEWQKNSDIIARQTEICIKDKQISGVVFFSLTALFSKASQNTAEREKLMSVFRGY